MHKLIFARWYFPKRIHQKHLQRRWWCSTIRIQTADTQKYVQYPSIPGGICLKYIDIKAEQIKPVNLLTPITSHPKADFTQRFNSVRFETNPKLIVPTISKINKRLYQNSLFKPNTSSLFNITKSISARRHFMMPSIFTRAPWWLAWRMSWWWALLVSSDHTNCTLVQISR